MAKPFHLTALLKIQVWNTGQGTGLDHIISHQLNTKVMIDDLESDPVELSRGVPQGLVLGPVLFNLYTSPLGEICKSHGIKYHQYSNDTQNYFSFKPAIPGDNVHCIRTLQNCIKISEFGCAPTC